MRITYLCIIISPYEHHLSMYHHISLWAVSSSYEPSHLDSMSDCNSLWATTPLYKTHTNLWATTRFYEHHTSLWASHLPMSLTPMIPHLPMSHHTSSNLTPTIDSHTYPWAITPINELTSSLEAYTYPWVSHLRMSHHTALWASHLYLTLPLTCESSLLLISLTPCYGPHTYLKLLHYFMSPTPTFHPHANLWAITSPYKPHTYVWSWQILWALTSLFEPHTYQWVSYLRIRHCTSLWDRFLAFWVYYSKRKSWQFFLECPKTAAKSATPILFAAPIFMEPNVLWILKTTYELSCLLMSLTLCTLWTSHLTMSVTLTYEPSHLSMSLTHTFDHHTYLWAVAPLILEHTMSH
jgi:hypothetical protein